MGGSGLADQLKTADRDRYLSTLYAPEDKRDALVALYAFNAEIAGVRGRVSQALPGEIRLQWWRDAIASAQASTGNPLADRLIETIDEHRLPLVAFDNMIEARIFDLYDDPMPARTDLEGYCGETAGALIQLGALILDPQAAASAAGMAGHAGCAQGITGLLRLLPRHRASGQCYVPRDLLAAAGTTPERFLAEDGDATIRAVSAMAALAREHLSAFEREAKRLPASLRPAFLPLAMTGAYLGRIAGREASILREAPDISEPRRHWLMLRRAWRGW